MLSLISQIPDAFVWHVLRQLAEAVSWLHSTPGKARVFETQDGFKEAIPFQPILHLDIKLSNVLVHWPQCAVPATHYPELKLGDFGQATQLLLGQKSREWATRQAEVAPPEWPHMSPAADIWGSMAPLLLVYPQKAD